MSNYDMSNHDARTGEDSAAMAGLSQPKDGSQMDDQYRDEWRATVVPDNDDLREMVIPLHEEKISVSKRLVTKGRVQVSTVTREHEELVDELLACEQVEIERTAINKPIDAKPSIREEGDILVIPVIEEVLVVERRLFLKEEVRIRRVHGTERHQERVTVRKQEAIVTRIPVDETAANRAAEIGLTESKKE